MDKKDRTLSIKDYLDEIKPYLSDIINDKKTQGHWKTHLTMAINFFLQRILKKLILCIVTVVL